MDAGGVMVLGIGAARGVLAAAKVRDYIFCSFFRSFALYIVSHVGSNLLYLQRRSPAARCSPLEPTPLRCATEPD